MTTQSIGCYHSGMTITLSSRHKDWLEAEVAAGRLASIEDGVREALEGWMLSDADDLVWAKLLVDEALASLDAGDSIPGHDFRREIAETITRLQRP